MLPTRGELGKPMIIQACSSPNADNASLARTQPARPIVKHAYRRMPRRFTQENSTFLRIIARSIVGSASVNFFPLCPHRSSIDSIVSLTRTYLISGNIYVRIEIHLLAYSMNLIIKIYIYSVTKVYSNANFS